MSDRLIQNSFTVESLTSEPVKHYNNDMCSVCQQYSRIEGSFFCKYCDYKNQNAGKELKKPIQRKIVYCKLDGCGFEAVEGGLCTAHFVASRPKPQVTTTPTVNEVVKEVPGKENAEPKSKSENHDKCFFCENPVTRLLGRCPRHQAAESDSKKRKCYWTGGVCTVQPQRSDHYFCSRHDREKIKIHNAASRRCQTRPAIKDSHVLDRLWEKEYNEGSDDDE